MTKTLTTDRLTLRPFCDADVLAIVDALSDIQIAKMIPVMPWPYGVDDARNYVETVSTKEPLTFAIEEDGMFHGSVGLGRQLGYWLRRDSWGRGIAVEASRAVLSEGFKTKKDPVFSGHRVENRRSRSVLRRLGFENTGTHTAFCHAEGSTVTLQDMSLTHENWEAMS